MAKRRRFSKPKKVIGPHVFQTKDLQSFASRIERIDRDIAALKEDRKQVLIEADARGFHKKLINKVVAEKQRDSDKFSAEMECLNMYRDALGILADTPLGAAAAAAKEREEKGRSNHKAFQSSDNMMAGAA